MKDITTEAQYWKLRGDVAKYRGKIIDETIMIEHAIDNIIAVYFCKDERLQDAYSMIFNNEYISFGAKEKILNMILSKFEFAEFIKKHKTIKGDITKIRVLRNSLAHTKIYSTSEHIDNYDGNALPMYKDTNKGKESLNLKMNELESHIRFIDGVLQVLWELYRIIHPKEKIIVEGE